MSGYKIRGTNMDSASATCGAWDQMNGHIDQFCDVITNYCIPPPNSQLLQSGTNVNAVPLDARVTVKCMSGYKIRGTNTESASATCDVGDQKNGVIAKFCDEIKVDEDGNTTEIKVDEDRNTTVIKWIKTTILRLVCRGSLSPPSPPSVSSVRFLP
eukprot:345357_1